MDCGQVADGEFVESGGDRSMLFELVYAALDGVAVLVALTIEGRWPPARAAAMATMTGLVGRDRDRGLDPSPPQPVPVRSTGIRLVGQYPIRASSGPPDRPGDLDRIQHRHELRAVTGLTSGDQLASTRAP